MDSLTQFSLAAAVSALCLGKKLGPRRAAILGGVLGTIPDLDVFLPVDNPVDAFVFHRGWTHSVFVHALATPIIGEVLVRFVDSLKGQRPLVWMTVFLCLTTHALIDAITVYGTRLFWPVYPDPIGIGSLFIIDPLYTLPLLFVVIWALARGSWTARLQKGLIAALVFSTAYMGLSLVLQANAENRAKAIFAEAGIEAKNIFAIAGPFNTVVWKVIGQEEDRYHNLYLSLFDNDDQARFYTHPTRPDLTACLNGNEAFEKLQWFSRGYYRAALENGKIIISDLRMGLTPSYVFRFAVAEYRGGVVTTTPPVAVEEELPSLDQDLDWLADRFVGEPSVRAAETLDEELETSQPLSC
ncbi:MAG: metal-dependent hydrolase [Pseudomonadota bacterium]